MPSFRSGRTITSSAQIVDDSVNSGDILNDSIVDADIKSDAAISWSKVSKSGSSLADLAIRLFTSLTDICGISQGGTGKTSWTIYTLLYGNGTSAPTELSLGSSGQFLKSNGAGAAPSWGNASVASAFTVNASANVRTSSDSKADVTNLSSYTKVKEILYNDSPGTIRVNMKLNVAGNGSGQSNTHGKVYVNGIAVGAEHKLTNGGVTSLSYTDDITVATGDLIQAYGYEGSTGGGDSSDSGIAEFRLEYDKTTIAFITNDVNL